MADKFAGKVVLVAGGTGGLGRAVSLAFLTEGATVAVNYRKQAGFDALQSAAGAAGKNLEGYIAEVTDEAAIGAAVAKIVAKYGRLDALVNSVGGYAGGTKLWELDPKVWDEMFALNLRSGFVLARAVLPQMLKQRTGAIVNIASKAAVDHAAGAAAYASSKAAAVAMIDCLAADLKGTGVRANSVLPSIIDTQANRDAMPKADFSKWPKAEDIARVVLFLCSDESKLVQGGAVPVYGDS